MKKYLFILLCTCTLLADDHSESPYFQIISKNSITDGFALESTKTNVVINGVIADVEIRQTYKNTTGSPIEAIYKFPASTKAAVHFMEMQIGDRKIVAEIKEKEEARDIYTQAKEDGKRTALLEQERENLFQMNVANILPNDTIRVVMKYTENISTVDGVYEFHLPSVVGPRYSNGKARKEFRNPKYTISNVYDYEVNIRLNSPVPIKELWSDTHEIEIFEDSEKEVDISLSDKGRKQSNRDFILNYKVRSNKIESGILFSKNHDENFFMIMVQPPKRVSREHTVKREYIFILDVSGSMGGEPINTSKKIMKNILEDLRPDEKFNLMAFAGGSEVLFSRSQVANKSNIGKAQRFVGNANSLGGTEMLSAIKKAMSIPKQEGFSRSFIILTDGYVSADIDVIRYIKGHLDECNFFAVGLGSSPNRYLIEGIARAGEAESFIASYEFNSEEISDKVVEYVRNPVFTSIKYHFTDLDAYDIIPEKVPDLFADRPIILRGKWKGKLKGKLHISGISSEGEKEIILDLEENSKKQKDQALKYLWAREMVRTKSDEYFFNGSKYTTKNEIIDLGLNYKLLTDFTSFVAVENEVVNPAGDLNTVNQVVPLPENNGEAYPLMPSSFRASYGGFSGGGYDNPLIPSTVKTVILAGFSYSAGQQKIINESLTGDLSAFQYNTGISIRYLFGIYSTSSFQLDILYSSSALEIKNQMRTLVIRDELKEVYQDLKYKLDQLNFLIRYKLNFGGTGFVIDAGLGGLFTLNSYLNEELVSSNSDLGQVDSYKLSNDLSSLSRNISDLSPFILQINYGLSYEISQIISKAIIVPRLEYNFNFPKIDLIQQSGWSAEIGVQWAF